MLCIRLLSFECCSHDQPLPSLQQGQFLWDNLIDVERQYQFDIEVERRIDFKKQLNVIREDRQSSDSQSDESTSPVVPGLLLCVLHLVS